MKLKNFGLTALLSISAVSFSGNLLATPLFTSGIPSGWTGTGNFGTLGANGVVTLAPSSTTNYGYVSTSGGISGSVLTGIGGTNGSILHSALFSANAGDALNFYFNYVTSDGSGFADYGWARLLDASSTEVALLFTARTAPTGSIVPGFSMPSPAATLTPTSVPIIGGGPAWSPLGGSSGQCFSGGCGYTGWILSQYSILAAGNYILEFGTANWSDTAFDSGLAFDGITVGGKPIEGGNVPEPSSLAILGLGLAGLAFSRRKAS